MLVQTYNPLSQAVACAASHDYATFSEAELERRRQLGYPPHVRMMAVRIEGSEDGARRCAEAVGNAARAAFTADGRLSMLGPAPAAIEKIRGKYRWQALFKAADVSALRRVHRALAALALRPPHGASLRFDMDPQSML